MAESKRLAESFIHLVIDGINLGELTDEKTSSIDWKLRSMRRNMSLRVHENKVRFLSENKNSTGHS
jgi:hypothetical protein